MFTKILLLTLGILTINNSIISSNLIDNLKGSTPIVINLNSDKPNLTKHVPLAISDPYDYSSVNNPYDEPYYLSDKQYQFNHIDLGDAWSSYRGEKIKVAVIDTGVRYDHHDFVDADGNPLISKDSALFTYNYSRDTMTIKTVNEFGYTVLQEDTSYITYENNNHSTAVTGTIFAQPNGKLGTGLAPNVEMINLVCENLYSVEVYAAIEYAIDLGVDIINISLGSYAETWTDDYGYTHKGGGDELVEQDTYYTNLAHDAGIFVVAAAGNEDTNKLSYPAACENVFSVGALADNSSTELAYYSNYGYNDVVAPGTVYVPWIDYTRFSSPNLDSYYYINGTSFASPMVAGAAALFKSKYTYATPNQIANAIRATAVDLGAKDYDEKFGHGRLSIENLMNYVPVESIEFLNNNQVVSLRDKTFVPTINFYPETSTNKNLSYSVSNPSIASIDDSGVVTLLKEGTVTIKAISEDGEKEANMTLEITGNGITVQKAPTSLTFGQDISASDIEVYYYDGAEASPLAFDDLTITYEKFNLGLTNVLVSYGNYQTNFDVTITNVGADASKFSPAVQADAYLKYFIDITSAECSENDGSFRIEVWESLKDEYEAMSEESKTALKNNSEYSKLNERYSLIVQQYGYVNFMNIEIQSAPTNGVFNSMTITIAIIIITTLVAVNLIILIVLLRKKHA